MKMPYTPLILVSALLSVYPLKAISQKKLQSIEKVKKDKDSFTKQAFVGPQSNNTYVVPTSQIINPAGKTITFPGRPVDVALNADQTILAVKNMSDVVFFNAKNQSNIQTLELPKGGNTFKGIGCSPDDNKVWITDNRGFLRSVKMDERGLFEWDDTILLPGIDKKGSYPGGLTIDKRTGLMYVSLKRNNTLGVVNLQTGKLEAQILVGIAPYAVVSKNDKAYVSNWGGRIPKAGLQKQFRLKQYLFLHHLALGRIVDAVSRIKFWKETAIFVIEDDPQNGLDHVDGHRTISFCISPYIKRKAVVSTHYNQNSILRTIQLMLGLPPMSQLDLVAMPMADCFTSQPDLTPYNPLPNNIRLNEMNPKLSAISGKQHYWAKKSMKMNLEENDDLDEEEEVALNRVLWHSVKGYNVPYPKVNKK